MPICVCSFALNSDSERWVGFKQKGTVKLTAMIEDVLVFKTIFMLGLFLSQQKDLNPLLKHHILDFIIVVFKYDVVSDKSF